MPSNNNKLQTDAASRQRGRSTSTNCPKKLKKEEEKFVAGTGWVPDTKTLSD
jgi:hypothetical protein